VNSFPLHKAGRVLAILLLTSACAPVPAAPTPMPTNVPAATRVTVKVANLPFIAFAPFYIGLDNGYFEEQNLDVQLVNFATQPDTIGAFVAGQIDVVAGQTSAGIFNLIARGVNARIVADKGFIDPNSCDNIVLLGSKSLATSGASTADALRGKKLDVVSGSWNQYLADKLLASLNLTTNDFDTVDIPSANDAQAMQSGQIDLIVQNEPWVTRLVADGNVPILKPASQVVPGSESAITMLGPKLIDQNSDVGMRFMLAYLKSVRTYKQGKTQQTLNTLSKYTKLDTSTLQQMCWPAIRGDGAVNVDSLLDFQSWAMQKGLQTTALTREQMWDPSFVTAVNKQLGQ
jgi:NitT/TauT family transport system substrate-binding protein